MTLSAKVIDAVNKAKIALGDAVITCQLIKNTSTYSNGKSTLTPASADIELTIADFDFNQVDGENVRVDDVKVVVFTVSADIDENDEIELDDVRYKVIKINPVRIGSSIAVLEVQLRK